MKKPVIFFSHSSNDRKVLVRIKELLNKNTDNKFNIYLSSDGQSIPFGVQWLYEIEKALEDSEVTFIFLSPNSIHSKWVSFESGYAYMLYKLKNREKTGHNRRRLVPIGIIGVDVAELGDPFNLLQGFNLQSQDGLNNILKILSDVFRDDDNTLIGEEFDAGDYEYIFSDVYDYGRSIFGEYISTIDVIQFEIVPLSGKIGLDYIRSKAQKFDLQKYNNKSLPDPYGKTKMEMDQFLFKGWEYVRYLYPDNDDEKFVASIDPVAYPIAIKFLDEVIKDLSHTSIDFKPKLTFTIRFIHDVFRISEELKIGAKLLRTDISFDSSKAEFYIFDGARFKFLDEIENNPQLILEIKYNQSSLEEFNIGKLISQLWECGILQRGRITSIG